MKIGYKYLCKPLLFLFDAEKVHDYCLGLGSYLGKHKWLKGLTSSLFNYSHPTLSQTLFGIEFSNPVGLAAGFDNNARLTRILPSVGFGFASLGTLTNFPCAGNSPPRLARLPRSKSLLVNKGYKNDGAEAIVQRLGPEDFSIPFGVSIDRTNIREIRHLNEAITDIISALSLFEKEVPNIAYYELNISCPNLLYSGNGDFYAPANLDELLTAIDGLGITKPIFVKMPLSETDVMTLKIVEVITKHSIAAVIIGNLQKDRSLPIFHPGELPKMGRGNFSGKPCCGRSNELISLVYKHFGSDLSIIGCGGIFSAEDAYEKIKRGASLVQMITGMIYEGPQLIGEINRKLVTLLKNDGLQHLSEARGLYNQGAK